MMGYAAEPEREKGRKSPSSFFSPVGVFNGTPLMRSREKQHKAEQQGKQQPSRQRLYVQSSSTGY